jgi:hypothetical protein
MERNGQLWCAEEDEYFLAELGNFINIKTIAETHQRTIGSIRSRQWHFARRLFSEGKNINEIENITKLSESRLRTKLTPPMDRLFEIGQQLKPLGIHTTSIYQQKENEAASLHSKNLELLKEFRTKEIRPEDMYLHLMFQVVHSGQALEKIRKCEKLLKERMNILELMTAAATC